MAEVDYSLTVVNDYHDYDEDEAQQPEDEINTDDYLQAVIESRNKASVDARLQMEQRAKYLLRQAELIERSKNEGRCHLQMFRDAAKNPRGSITEAIPPQILAAPSKTTTPSSDTNTRAKESSARSSRRSSITSSISGDGSQRSNGGGVVDAAAGAGDYSAHRRARWLEEENQRMRETIEQMCTSALTIQTNADLKLMKLEFEIAHLRQKLADEAANHAKVHILNESLRKQLTLAASGIVLTKNGTSEEKRRYSDFMHMHHRELTLEKNMNGLITSRHKALKENTALKKLILGTCFGCRQLLPPGLKRTLDAMSFPLDGVCQPIPTVLAESSTTDVDTPLSLSKSTDSSIEKKLSFDSQPNAVVPPLPSDHDDNEDASATEAHHMSDDFAATQKAVDSMLEEVAAVPVRPPFAMPNYSSQPSTRSMSSSKSGNSKSLSARNSRRSSVTSASARGGNGAGGSSSDFNFPPQFSTATLSNDQHQQHAESVAIVSQQSQLEKNLSEKGMIRESPTSTTALLAEDVSLKLHHSHNAETALNMPDDYSPQQPPTHRDFLRKELSTNVGGSQRFTVKNRSSRRLDEEGAVMAAAGTVKLSPSRLHKSASQSKGLSNKKKEWKNLVFQVPGE